MFENTNMGIAMESMLFSTVKPLKVYNGQSQCPLPPGEKAGYGNALFIISPTKADADNCILNGFIRYRSPLLYKLYMIDFYYKEKIGSRHIILNNTGVYKKQFMDMELSGVRQVLNESKKKMLENQPNVMVNLGNWHELFFKWRYKKSIPSICEDYIRFLGSRINDSIYLDYDKVLYIDLSQWFDGNLKKFGLDKDSLNNPVSILLTTIYKFPDLLSALGRVSIMIVDSKNKSFLKIDYTDMVPNKYNNIKSRILSMEGVSSYVNSTSINADNEPVKVSTPVNNKKATAENEDPTVTKIVDKMTSERLANENRARQQIISTLKKNLMGDVEDITPDLMDTVDAAENNDLSKAIQTSEYDTEIDTVANDYIDQNPDVLLNVDDAVSKLENVVKKKVYVAKFTPERSVEKLERMKLLEGMQENVIGLPSFADLQSKIIDETDVSNAVNTSNINILKSKFANFDKSYNNKKLAKDIDASVSILSDATSKVYIIGKTEEDTSDQLNLKKTITYNLRDENGVDMKLKFDIPVIFEDRYIYINGNKKEIHHQLILKPVVKTKPDTVQIVTTYNKAFITRQGSNDYKTSALRKLLMLHPEDFKIKLGNGSIMNKDYVTTMEFDMIAKYIYEFHVGQNIFITDINKLLNTLTKLNIKYDDVDLSKYIIVGYNKTNRKPITLNIQSDSYTEKIANLLTTESKTELISLARKSSKGKFMYNKIKILENEFPLVVIMLYFEGFKSVMDKAKIEYKFIQKEDVNTIDVYEWGLTELADGYIAWKRYPMENSLLMNGLSMVPLDMYAYDELQSKDTYIAVLSQFFKYVNAAYNMDQFKDFMIDEITKEILIDYHLPTDLVSIFAYANKLLTTNSFLPETNMLNMRLRSNEIISACVYKAVTSAYGQYRKTLYKKNPKKISVKQNDVITRLEKSGLIEVDSILNPILQLSKIYGVTYKGERGIGMEKAMTLDKRAYNESMLGVLGITTNPDASVGISRQLTFEPNITSTRGYIEVVGKKNVDELNSANLLTAAEMLTPLGVQHDDPTRTAINKKYAVAV